MWLENCLKLLKGMGVVFIERDTVKYEDEKFLNKIGQKPTNVYFKTADIILDENLLDCGNNSENKCAIKEFVDTGNCIVQEVKESTPTRKISVRSTFKLKDKMECCKGCFYNKKLEALIEKTDHAKLPYETYLKHATEPSKMTIIGLKIKPAIEKKKDNKTNPKDKKKEKEAKDNSAYYGALVLEYNGEKYLISLKDGVIDLFKLKIEEKKREFFSKKVIYPFEKAVDVQEILKKSTYSVSIIDMNFLYRRDASNDELSNILSKYSAEYTELYKQAFVDDNEFKNIRDVVHVDPHENLMKNQGKKNKKKDSKYSFWEDFSNNPWKFVGISIGILIFFVITTILVNLIMKIDMKPKSKSA